MATVSSELPVDAAKFLATAFPQYVKTNGTSFPVDGLAYDATTSESAYWKFVPFAYGTGDWTCSVAWYADTATANAVVWQVAVAAITPNTDSGDIETKAFATAQQGTSTHLGTTGQRLHQLDITIVAANLDSALTNDVLFLRLSRLPADGSDTMTGDAIVTNVWLSYSDT